MSGSRPSTAVRGVVADSWRRIQQLGLDPERGGDVPVAVHSELESLRSRSGLIPVLGLLQRSLSSIAMDGVHIMVITDRTGRILWQQGHTAVRSQAERLGFMEGAGWREETVGTNGIGTALHVDRPVQIFGPEHYVRSHHGWVCTAAPIIDPRDGGLLGMVDIAGPVRTVHPTTLALVDSVAQLASATMRQEHQAGLGVLRAAALLRTKSGGLVTDRYGWVAAGTAAGARERVQLPDDLGAGLAHIPTLGTCFVEPFGEGWFIRTALGQDSPPIAVTLHLHGKVPSVTLVTEGECSTTRLTTRHAEILYTLACEPDGRTAVELSRDIYGDDTHSATIRAEISRLRGSLGIFIEDRPYRLPEWLDVMLELPDDPSTLLTRSNAPVVERHRRLAHSVR